MPSTYTDNGGIEKIATGEQSGTWGDTTNTNLDILDRITNGVGTITLSGTTHTLDTTNGTLSDGMYKVLVLSGSSSLKIGKAQISACRGHTFSRGHRHPIEGFFFILQGTF